MTMNDRRWPATRADDDIGADLVPAALLDLQHPIHRLSPRRLDSDLVTGPGADQSLPDRRNHR